MVARYTVYVQEGVRFPLASLMTDYIISDTHFCHANIIKYCGRPFKTVGEMDKTLIDNINTVVDEEDRLIHMGDFAFGRLANAQTITFIRRQIRCRHIILIVGNHDKEIVRDTKLRVLFDNNSHLFYTNKIIHNKAAVV